MSAGIFSPSYPTGNYRSRRYSSTQSTPPTQPESRGPTPIDTTSRQKLKFAMFFKWLGRFCVQKRLSGEKRTRRTAQDRRSRPRPGFRTSKIIESEANWKGLVPGARYTPLQIELRPVERFLAKLRRAA